jgi:hypothetical protein
MMRKCSDCKEIYETGPCDDYDNVQQAHYYQLCVASLKSQRDAALARAEAAERNAESFEATDLLEMTEMRAAMTEAGIDHRGPQDGYSVARHIRALGAERRLRINKAWRVTMEWKAAERERDEQAADYEYSRKLLYKQAVDADARAERFRAALESVNDIADRVWYRNHEDFRRIALIASDALSQSADAPEMSAKTSENADGLSVAPSPDRKAGDDQGEDHTRLSDSLPAEAPQEPGTDDEVRRAEQSGLLALALGYNELAKHATRDGDKVYWRLMRGEVVKKMSYDPFTKTDPKPEGGK